MEKFSVNVPMPQGVKRPKANYPVYSDKLIRDDIPLPSTDPLYALDQLVRVPFTVDYLLDQLTTENYRKDSISYIGEIVMIKVREKHLIRSAQTPESYYEYGVVMIENDYTSPLRMMAEWQIQPYEEEEYSENIEY